MKKAMLHSNSSRIFSRRVKKKELESGDRAVGASASSQKNSERSDR